MARRYATHQKARALDATRADVVVLRGEPRPDYCAEAEAEGVAVGATDADGVAAGAGVAW